MVTVTPGSTAPLVSVTRPLSSAVDNCADAAAAVRRSISTPTHTSRTKRTIQPPLVPCQADLKVGLYVRLLDTLRDAVLIVLLADVFHDLVARQGGQPCLEMHGERLGVCARILHRDLDVHVTFVDARPPLDRVQLLGVRMSLVVEPRLVVEADGG